MTSTHSFFQRVLVFHWSDCQTDNRIRYHVPEHLQGHIDYITPGVKLTPVVKRHTKVKRASHLTHMMPETKAWSLDGKEHSVPPKAMGLSPDVQGCGYNMTPTCIKAMYKIPDATSAVNGNSLGLYEQGDYFAKSDVDLFCKEYAPWVPQGTYPIPALIDGANYSVPPYSSLNTGESDIDIDLV